MIEPKSQVKKCSAHAEILQQNEERTVYRLRETDGEVRITSYPVFPGIELAYHDVHAPSYRLAEQGAAGLIEIQHCREGRAEYCCGGEHYFLAPGDLSVVRRAAIEGEVEFPTGHYHGITVTLDPALAPDCLSCILQDVDVRPSALGKPIANYMSGEYNKKMIPLSVVMDERICTGHEYALFWAGVRRYLKHPELLEGKPTEENAYPAEECV